MSILCHFKKETERTPISPMCSPFGKCRLSCIMPRPIPHRQWRNCRIFQTPMPAFSLCYIARVCEYRKYWIFEWGILILRNVSSTYNMRRMGTRGWSHYPTRSYKPAYLIPDRLQVFHQVVYIFLTVAHRITPDISCLLYTSDAADEEDSVDLGGRRIIKKK